MPNQNEALPGIVVGALRGGSGKTMVSIGLIAALSSMGHRVAPFKKGPDYIDAGWLSLAAGERPCYNLDTFLIEEKRIRQTYAAHSRDCDIAVIEGNRGIYDCIDTHGETSTAELSKLLGLPILLIIDGTKTTRTMAAVVSGCSLFDPSVRIRGVILNRIAGARHEGILRRSIEEHCGIPVLGAIPKLRQQRFPERHMGLVPTPEHAWARSSIEAAADVAREHIDIAAVIRMAGETEPLLVETDGIIEEGDGIDVLSPKAPTIAIIRDSAFQFYYPENLEALEAAGAHLVFVSPLESDTLPDIDGMYIGGGFPETHANELSRNRAFRDRLKTLAEDGLPIYAECGGLMYLGEKLVLEGKTHDMAGILPVTFGFSKRPQGHGYTILEVTGKNPYFRKGMTLKGHEFHYSSVLAVGGRKDDLAYTMVRGTGLDRWPGRPVLQERAGHLYPPARFRHPGMGTGPGGQGPGLSIRVNKKAGENVSVSPPLKTKLSTDRLISFLGWHLVQDVGAALDLFFFVPLSCDNDAVHVNGFGVIVELQLVLLSLLEFLGFPLFLYVFGHLAGNLVTGDAGLHVVTLFELQGLALVVVMAFAAGGPIFLGVLLVRKLDNPFGVFLIGRVIHRNNVGRLVAGLNTPCHEYTGNTYQRECEKQLFELHKTRIPPSKRLVIRIPKLLSLTDQRRAVNALSPVGRGFERKCGLIKNPPATHMTIDPSGLST